MSDWTAGFLRRFRLAQQFMLASLVILVSGMLVIGWWVGEQIKTGVINQTAATTALYVDSFVAPQIQRLSEDTPLTSEQMASLSRLLEDTSLGQYIIAFKIWDSQGKILYSTNSFNVGRVYPPSRRLNRAFQGEVVSRISDLQDKENAQERERWSRLLETYSPARLQGTSHVLAVAEFYQTVEGLEKAILAAQMRSWLLVGGATLAMYLLLAGIVQRSSNIIVRQEDSLRAQVTQLTGLVKQNEELHERVRRAATRTTALNERFLRRISGELHDGPAQALGLALLRIDAVVDRCEKCPVLGPEGQTVPQDLKEIETSLQHALKEVRSVASGLRLPELEHLTLSDTIARVVHGHEQRTRTNVKVSFSSLPEEASLVAKIALYRLIQEALNNAYRHGGGVGQRVKVQHKNDHLDVEVADEGPGFAWEQVANQDEHLGLAGMRERVESLGGVFLVDSQPGSGTKVIAQFPLYPSGDVDER